LEPRWYLSGTDPNWAVALGAEGSDQVRALTVDSTGNTYTAINFSTGSQRTVEVLKHSPSGTELSRQAIATYSTSTSDFLRIDGLVVDVDGNLFVAGDFRGDFDLDGVPGIELDGSTAIGNGFVVKYDSAGAFAWAHSLNCSAANFFVNALSLSDSHAYVVGNFFETISYDNNPILASTAGDDWAGFLVQIPLDQPESAVAVQIQESGSVWPTEVLVADNGGTDEILVAGEFGILGPWSMNSTAVIGGEVMKTFNRTDAFLVKFHTDASVPEPQWAHQIAERAVRRERNGMSSADALTRSSDGSIYVGGHFLGTSDFGSETLTPVNWSTDGYVVRIEEVNGSPQVSWAHHIRSSETVTIQGIGALSDTLYVAGNFVGATDFDPSGLADPELIPSGEPDLFLLELGAISHEFLAVRQAGGEGRETVVDLIVGASAVHTVARSDSPLVPTMGGTLETAGSYDGILIHVNPAAPQLTIEPTVTAIGASQTQMFTALDGDQPVPVDWWLDGTLVTDDPSPTYVLPTDLALGRHELVLDMNDLSGASYRHVFDVTAAFVLNPPSDLTAAVALRGRNSDITLTWTDDSNNEDGFYIEYNNPQLTSDWQLAGTVTANVTTFTQRVNNRVGEIQYRVRSFAVVDGQTKLSEATEPLNVDPAVSGTVGNALAASSRFLRDLAAAVDELFGENKS
jgi:hypothetical protein